MLGLLVMGGCAGPPSHDDAIIGHWHTEKLLLDGNERPVEDIIQGIIFREDGTMTIIDERGEEEGTGLFEIAGDTLLLGEEGEKMEKSLIQTLNDTQLVVQPLDDEGRQVVLHLGKESK